MGEVSPGFPVTAGERESRSAQGEDNVVPSLSEPRRGPPVPAGGRASTSVADTMAPPGPRPGSPVESGGPGPGREGGRGAHRRRIPPIMLHARSRHVTSRLLSVRSSLAFRGGVARAAARARAGVPTSPVPHSAVCTAVPTGPALVVVLRAPLAVAPAPWVACRGIAAMIAALVTSSLPRAVALLLPLVWAASPRRGFPGARPSLAPRGVAWAASLSAVVGATLPGLSALALSWPAGVFGVVPRGRATLALPLLRLMARSSSSPAALASISSPLVAYAVPFG